MRINTDAHDTVGIMARSVGDIALFSDDVAGSGGPTQ
jgi:hypothetical protein